MNTEMETLYRENKDLEAKIEDVESVRIMRNENLRLKYTLEYVEKHEKAIQEEIQYIQEAKRIDLSEAIIETDHRFVIVTTPNGDVYKFQLMRSKDGGFKVVRFYLGEDVEREEIETPSFWQTKTGAFLKGVAFGAPFLIASVIYHFYFKG